MAKVQGEAIRGHLDLLVLAALQSEPGHGYGVIARLRAESNGALDLPEGTIYPALHRLENARFLAATGMTAVGHAGGCTRSPSAERPS